MYIITFFNKHHQTTTPMTVSMDLEDVKETIKTLNASIGYDYDGGTGVWDQPATGYFGWSEVPMLEKTTIGEILEKKKKADNPYGR